MTRHLTLTIAGPTSAMAKALEDRPIFVCAECTFIGGHHEHMDHVMQTDHQNYRTINPNGSVVWTRTAA